MRVSGSFRRIAVVAALTVLGLGVSASAVQAGDFQVKGTFVPTAIQGNSFELSLDGNASPGGKFAGTFLGKAKQQGNIQYGVGVMDFGGGDTLTIFVYVEYDAATGLLIGTYEITGGTGKLANASGSGGSVWLPAALGETSTFEFGGTLSF